MVRIEEVRDRAAAAAAAAEEDDGFETESSYNGSEYEEEDVVDLDPEEEAALMAYNPDDETLGERLSALQDMVSPETRSRIVNTWNTTSNFVKTSAWLAGNAAWVVTTTAILIGLPAAISIENEGALIQQEKELQRQQSQSSSDISTPTHLPTGPFGQLQTGAQGQQQQQPSGVVPPGF